MQEASDDSRAAGGETPYPVQFSVEYPEASNRLTALMRIVLVIPILVVSAFVSGAFTTGNQSVDDYLAVFYAGGALWIAPLLMILFRQKYPRWWFDWNLELSRFSARISAYILLMRDEYPSTDEQQAVSLEIEYPDVERQLNRFLPIVKWLLVIPHMIILAVLAVGVLIVSVIAWLAVLTSGRYPQGLFTFVEGTLRWSFRAAAYAFMLTTDRYPPFRLSP
ncbi:MAG: DUF4389 domain-containing protein [Chloroflexi bacterium]|nr:DUF4389 domain-containing protein [Chloroflexota bacterium]